MFSIPSIPSTIQRSVRIRPKGPHYVPEGSETFGECRVRCAYQPGTHSIPYLLCDGLPWSAQAALAPSLYEATLRSPCRLRRRHPGDVGFFTSFENDVRGTEWDLAWFSEECRVRCAYHPGTHSVPYLLCDGLPWSAQAMLAPSLYEAMLRSPGKIFHSGLSEAWLRTGKGWSTAPALQSLPHRFAMDLQAGSKKSLPFPRLFQA